MSEKVFQECVDLWGEVSQILMAVEELNELSVELLHALRANKPFDIDRITEEIADVDLMIDQLKFIFSISDEDLHKAREKKIQRLKEIIESEKEVFE